MKVGSLDPDFTQRVFFALSGRVSVPRHAGCYMVANVVDDIIYIGQTTNLRQRFEQHLDNSRMTERTSRGLGHWFYFLATSPHDLIATEMRLLSLYKFHNGSLPPLNRAGP